MMCLALLMILGRFRLECWRLMGWVAATEDDDLGDE